MSNINFCLKELQKVYEQSAIIYKQNRDLTASKKYILERLFPLNNSECVCVFRANKLEVLEKSIFIDQIRNRFPCNDIIEWYKHTVDIDYYNLTIEPLNPNIIFKNNNENFINNFVKSKAVYSKYADQPENIKNSVQLILNHLKVVNCNNDIKQFEYLLKIIKNMCLGVKNNIAVLMRGIAEGTGKSTFCTFLMKHVIGCENTCVGDPSMIKKGFNYGMYTKRFVYFEEIPIFESKSYSQISTTFKRWITEDYINYEEKSKPIFSSKNIHTIWVLSNENCIENDDGRRWFCLDINPRMKGNTEYFNKIYSNCFNDAVGNGFFSYLIDNVEIPNNWVADANMPMTSNKKDSCAEKLDKVYEFIKTNYVLKGLGINSSISDLVHEYNETGLYYKMSTVTFNKYLKENKDFVDKLVIGHQSKPYLRISKGELLNIFKNNNWIHSTDEFNAKPKNCDSEKMYDELEAEIQKNTKLQEELFKLKESVKVSETSLNGFEDSFQMQYNDLEKQLDKSYKLNANYEEEITNLRREVKNLKRLNDLTDNNDISSETMDDLEKDLLEIENSPKSKNNIIISDNKPKNKKPIKKTEVAEIKIKSVDSLFLEI